MKKPFWSVFILALFVCGINSHAQHKRQGFNTWANFQVDNGMVIWQAVYQRPGLDKDSVLHLVMSIVKANPRFTLLNENADEFTFEVIKLPLPNEGLLYKGKVIIEIKPEKYRLTLKSVTLKGADPQSALEDDQKYFKHRKFHDLEVLSSQFMSTFDFKSNKGVKTARKDW